MDRYRITTIDTMVYYKQSDLSQRWRGSQGSKWQQKAQALAATALASERVRLQIPAYGESRSREPAFLLTAEQSGALCSFVRGGTGCRNLQPLCLWLIEKWSLEKRDPKVKRKNGLEQNTLKHTEKELSKIWRKIQFCD